MGVYLCRSQTGMAQEFLDRFDTRPVFQHMGRIRMPEDVWTAFGNGTHRRDIFMDDPVDEFRVCWLSFIRQDQRIAGVSEPLIPQGEIGIDRFTEQIAERDDPLFPAFSGNADLLLLMVDIGTFHGDEFCLPQTESVQELDHNKISVGTELKIVHHGFLQGAHPLLPDDFRQAFFLLRCLDFSKGVDGNTSEFAQQAVKGPQRGELPVYTARRHSGFEEADHPGADKGVMDLAGFGNVIRSPGEVEEIRDIREISRYGMLRIAFFKLQVTTKGI